MKTSFLSWTMALVAASALIACGDDTNPGGGGNGQGGNGDGGDGTTTAGPTTTSGATTTASTTTTSSTGGDGGGGGDTTSQGGAGGTGGGDGGSGGGFVNPGCTEITFADLESGVIPGQGTVIFGTPDPALGGADEDVANIELWDDLGGPPIDPPGTMAGTYDLADETNYATCGRCVVAYEDIVENQEARFYFQERGTLELEGTAMAYGYGAVTLTDVILREATKDAQGNSTPVVDGECLYIAELTYDNPSPAPDGWTCDPDYYGVDDGCDCGCGVIDTDCEDPEQEIFGCDLSQTCSAQAMCEDELAGCAAPTEIDGATFSGSTLNDVLEPGVICSAGTGGTQVFSYTATTAGEHTFTVSNLLGDVVVGIRGDCNQFFTSYADEVDPNPQAPTCTDDASIGSESFTVTLAAGEEIALVVQAFSNTTEGLFNGTVDAP